MKVEDFDYPLPEELIAQEPLPRRDDSRMMVLQRNEGGIIHSYFRQFEEHLKEGDCLVLNDTKVIPARLYGKRADTGGRVEILLLEPANEPAGRGNGPAWLALAQSRSAIPLGETITMGQGELTARVEGILGDGTRLLRFDCGSEDFPRLLEALGQPPLPPYIKRSPVPQDADRYQTVYARREGAVAAPTAGLHFTPQALEALRRKGVRLAFLTLHVGLGTFRPVKVEKVEDHQMHSEPFELPAECAQQVNDARREGRRVIAVGTTVVRVLETCASEDGRIVPCAGRTSLFIYPGYRFKVVDGLLTNFHLPCSTLLMLVCAFAGANFILQAYRQAVSAGYRFFSYGDCMILLP